MLRIRPEQAGAFQPEVDEAFARRLVEYLLDAHPAQDVWLPTGITTLEEIPGDVLHEMVAGGIARARRYGLSWESALGAFVAIMFVSAPNFDEHPALRWVLTDEALEPNSRIDELWSRTSDEDWETAKRGYDARAWSARSEEA